MEHTAPAVADPLSAERTRQRLRRALGAPPPRPDEFSERPASWYFLCTVRELRAGPLSKHVLGRELVAWLDADDHVVVMDSRCVHLGADLGRGEVVNGRIRCPFHGWEYGPDGRCVGGAGCSGDRPAQRVYPAQQQHGLVFFFNGSQVLFPLPDFADGDARERQALTAGSPTSFDAASTWFMVAAHGFDLQHFETVHARPLIGPLLVDTPAPFARRSRYTAQVLGGAWYDRLLRVFAGRTVDISITTHGGTLIWVTGDFRRVRSRFLIATRPIEGGQTRCDVIVFARSSANPLARTLVQPLVLWVRRLFTRGYLQAEVTGLGHPRYNPDGLVDGDRELIDYFRWAASLP